MTKRVGGIVHIEKTPPAPCDLCGRTAELRPYGPNEENVCIDCAEKNPEAMQRGIEKMFGDAELVTVPLFRKRKGPND